MVILIIIQVTGGYLLDLKLNSPRTLNRKTIVVIVLNEAMKPRVFSRNPKHFSVKETCISTLKPSDRDQ